MKIITFANRIFKPCRLKWILIYLVAFPAFGWVSEREAPPKPKLNLNKVANYIINFTNIERFKNGLPALRYHWSLSDGAKIHSDYMAMKQEIGHTETTLVNPNDRVMAAKLRRNHDANKKTGREKTREYPYSYCCGENVITSFDSSMAGIGYYKKDDEKGNYKLFIKDVEWFTEETLARDLVHRWMNSPGHRANILNKEYDYMGAGISEIYPYSNWPIFGTQVFAFSEESMTNRSCEISAKSSHHGDNFLELDVVCNPSLFQFPLEFRVTEGSGIENHRIEKNTVTIKITPSEKHKTMTLFLYAQEPDQKDIEYPVAQFEVFIKNNNIGWRLKELN